MSEDLRRTWNGKERRYGRDRRSGEDRVKEARGMRSVPGLLPPHRRGEDRRSRQDRRKPASAEGIN